MHGIRFPFCGIDWRLHWFDGRTKVFDCGICESVEVHWASIKDSFIHSGVIHSAAHVQDICARFNIPKGTNAQNPSATQTTSQEEIYTHFSERRPTRGSDAEITGTKTTCFTCITKQFMLYARSGVQRSIALGNNRNLLV